MSGLTRSRIFQGDGKINEVKVYQWSPVKGCDFFHKECPVNDCWAAKAARLHAKPWAESENLYRVNKLVMPESKDAYENFRSFTPQFLESMFDKDFPSGSIILVGWQSDFACWKPEWKKRVIQRIKDDNIDAAMPGEKQNVFLFLSKFPGKAYDIDMPSNCWKGWTITSPTDYWSNLDHNYYKGGNKTFMFLEPLIKNFFFECRGKLTDWVIVGGETGNNARPLKPEGIERIVHNAKSQGIPLWFKGWGKRLPAGQDFSGDTIDGKIYHETPDWWKK